jgi:hypothetical protein
VTPAELLVLARRVMTIDDAPLGVNRSLVAAILTRQALEETLDAFWQYQLPALMECSSRSQLITLAYYLKDPELAAEVTYAWYVLSAACHHSVIGLPAPVAEMAHLVDIVEHLWVTVSSGVTASLSHST